MKHYFRVVDYYANRFTQPIYSPVDGVVLYLTKPTGPYADQWKADYEQQTGKAPPVDYRDWNIFIRPDAAPNVWVTHMHVQPTDTLVDAIPTHIEYAIIGAVILAGVTVDELIKRYAAKRAARQQEFK